MRGFLAGGQNHFGSLSATSQSWLWYKATSVAGPEGQAYPLACIGLKLGWLLPLDFTLSGFAVALRGPSRTMRVSLIFRYRSQPFPRFALRYSSPVSLFPSLQACAMLCCVLCRWAPVLAHLLSSAAACVCALLLIEFVLLSCYGLPLWLAVDW